MISLQSRAQALEVLVSKMTPGEWYVIGRCVIGKQGTAVWKDAEIIMQMEGARVAHGTARHNAVAIVALRNDALSLIRDLVAALSEARAAALEEAAKACMEAWPRAHTYASENADLYRMQDNIRDRCIAAIRSLRDREPPHE